MIKAPPKPNQDIEIIEKRPNDTKEEKAAKKQKYIFLSCFYINLSCLFTLRKNEEEEKDAKKDAATEAELQAAKQRETIPLEERIKMFKEMLIEKKVRALFIVTSLLIELSNRCQRFLPGKRSCIKSFLTPGI